MKPPAGSVVAIVPAAGRSRRMGAPKLLLPVAGQPMLIRTMETLLAGGAVPLFVVTTAELRDRLALSGRPDVHVVLNDAPDSEMIDSVRIGLRAAERLLPPAAGFLVCPADHPALSAGDVRACLIAFCETPDRIVIASHGGRRGHPLIFPSADAAYVHSAACDGGLHALARAHAPRVRLVACSSPGVTQDVDTPFDYEAIG